MENLCTGSEQTGRSLYQYSESEMGDLMSALLHQLGRQVWASEELECRKTVRDLQKICNVRAVKLKEAQNAENKAE